MSILNMKSSEIFRLKHSPSKLISLAHFLSECQLSSSDLHYSGLHVFFIDRRIIRKVPRPVYKPTGFLV